MTATESDKAATLMALLIITLLAVHLSQDVVYGYEAARLAILIPLLVAALWLAIVPAIHLSGRGIRAEVIQSSGGFFFLWTLIALTMSASFAGLLSIHGLWRVRRSVLGFFLWTIVTVAAGAALLGSLIYR